MMRRLLRALLGRDRDSDRLRVPATCRTRLDLELAMGTVCTVVGSYAVHPFHNQKGVQFREWPVVVLDDETAVLIESLWDERSKHPPETIARFAGRRVSVKGMLHAQPPGSFVNIGVPCIAPVDHIEEAP